MYLPYTQKPQFSTLTMVVRSQRPAASLAPRLRRRPTVDYQALDAVVDQATSPRRFVLAILGAFAGTALLLAALGIYAVLSYAV